MQRYALWNVGTSGVPEMLPERKGLWVKYEDANKRIEEYEALIDRMVKWWDKDDPGGLDGCRIIKDMRKAREGN